MKLVLAGTLVAVAAVALVTQRPDAFQAPSSHPAIGYATRPPRDRVLQLNRRLDAGTARLTFSPGNGYLQSVLAGLDVPVESQTLVFSLTSAQADLINPRNPRALFFNDAVAVGWVRGADLLELAVQDPAQGAIFYTLEQKAAAKPRFVRQTDECLLCHLTWDTLAVPGFLTMSTFPMSDDPKAYASGVLVEQRTPLLQRWGGWYVTGKVDPVRHLGNLPVIRPAAEIAKPAPPTPHLATVDGKFDTTGYLSRYSDVTALMVLNHQAHMSNLLTRLGWETRLVEYEHRPADRVREAAGDLVDYMLFVDEAPIGRKLEGSSGFAEKFMALGPRDSKGRSLRQLNLDLRLMQYPCSYMIYSEAFDALPAAAKAAAYDRLWQVLSGQDKDKKYKLSLVDRQAIVEILRETKKDLPAFFQPVTK